MYRGAAAVRAWLWIWYVGYVVLRVLLRITIGRRRRNWVQAALGLHYGRMASAGQGGLLPRREPHVNRIVRRILGAPGARSFVDVGAFLGWYTSMAHRFLMWREGFSIVAVEPDPDNYRELEKAFFGVRGVHLVNSAVHVSDDAEIDFHVGKKGPGGLSESGSCTPTRWHVGKGYLSGERIRVNTVRLDTLIRRYGLERVDLVKMDIEGAEYPVLTDPSLDLSRVENMVVEVHYRWGSRESEEIMRALAKHGFKIVPLYPDQNSDTYHLLACRGEVPW